MLSALSIVLIAATGNPRVELLPGPVKVSSPFVRLAQVAEIHPDREVLGRMVVATVRKGSTFITRELVENRLKSRNVKAKLLGPSYLCVKYEDGRSETPAQSTPCSLPESKEGGLELLREAALSGVENSAGATVLRLDAINCWGDDGPVDPGSLTGFHVEAAGGGTGVRWARFTARDSAGHRVHGWARFVVEEKIRAVVASRPVRRGELLTGEKLVVREVTLPFSHFDGFQKLENVKGRHAARDVRSGAVLQTADVKRELAVQKGAVLMVTLNGPAFHLSDRVVAMKDAEEGEVIKVRNCRSGRIFRVKVLSRHTAVPVE